MGEEEARKRGNTVGIRDQAMDLAKAQGFKVSRQEADLMPTPTVFHTTMHDEPIDYFLEREARSSTGQIGKSLGVAVRMETLPTPKALDGVKGNLKTSEERLESGHQVDLPNVAIDLSQGFAWGKFGPAIKRWEETIGLPAPAPTKPDGKDNAHRLSSKFTEWMMGLPDGWITDCGLTRNEELKAAGNGVVPQQAELALRILLGNEPFTAGGGASESANAYGV